MRTVAPAVVFVFALTGPALAQPGLPPIPALPAPSPVPAIPDGLPLPAAEPRTLPGGADVSRPLQPVTVPPTPEPVPTLPPEPKTTTTTTVVEPVRDDRDPTPGKILGGVWSSDEVLVWWPKAAPVPPLVTGSRSGAPVLGRPGTSVLIGNHGLDNQDIAGYRLAYGFSLDGGDRVGFEGRYFFLGSRTVSDYASDLGNGRFHEIGLPYINANTGEEDVLQLGRPGQSSVLVNAFTSTRVQGAEANLIGNLYAGRGLKVHAIAGYRHLQVNEGLRLEERWLQYPTPESGFYKTLGMIADQFDAHNEFHGGQLGLLTDWHRGPFYVELTGKVAFGTNFQTVTIDGATHLITAASPVPLLRTFPGGVYAQPTNMGRVTNTSFAVVPEGTFKVGLKYGDRGRFYIGYNFLMLNDAVRPGDQIDRVLNPSQIPLVGQGGPFAGPERPRVPFVHSDFWVQGLVIGFEGRF